MFRRLKKINKEKLEEQDIGEIRIKKFKKNLIQLIIGLVLLTISFIYLQSNPAERTSVVSGVRIIYQKIKIMVVGVFNKNSELLEDKYRLEKNYKEIILVFENGKCLDINELKKLKGYYEKLQKMDVESYSLNRYDLYEIFGKYYKILNNNCTPSQS